MLKLILIDAKSAGHHETFRVEDDEVEVIGRKAPRLRMPDTRVSRAHSEVRVQNGVWVIRDLGSANGTLVNNRVIGGLCELEEDDVIQVGRATLIVAVARVEPDAAEAAAGSGPDDTAAAGDSGLPDTPEDFNVAGALGLTAAPSSPDEPVEPLDAEPPAPAESPLDAAGSTREVPDPVEPPELTPDDALSADATDGEDGEDEPVEPEPTGLRLANYDVLDDDELAEVLAADAPPAVPVVDTPVEIAFPDPDAATHRGDDDLLLDVDPDADLGAGLGGSGFAHDPAPDDPLDDPLDDRLDPPRRGAASADSRLITPAPESPLGGRSPAPGFPWRGTAAAVLTLAAVGTGAFLLSRGGLTGPLTPVTGTPAASGAPAVDRDPLTVATTSARPPTRRGQPSPFDAGPMLTAPITPRPAPRVTPTPRVEPPKPQPQPQRIEPAPKPEPSPTEAVTQRPNPEPAPAATLSAGTPTPETTPPAPAPAAVASATTPPDAVDPSPAIGVLPTAARPDPTPRPAAPRLPDAAPASASDAGPITPPPVSAPISAPISAPLAAPRRVVYVVDASGSMVDSMNQGVLTWLETQIGNLRPADAFSVIFFHDAEVLETPPAGLKPGRRAEQVKALDWMAPESGNMRPRGRSRPLAALRLAASYDATEVILLTDDNFGTRSGEDVTPEALVEVLRPANANAAIPTVHTVQFFYEDSDGRLKAIASLFGGRYQFVEEPPFEARPIVDDLLDG